MTPREQLYAYLATLSALVLVVIGGLIIASIAPSVLGKFEAFGFGTVTGGLIGVLRIPSARQPAATGTTETGDVNVTPSPPAT